MVNYKLKIVNDDYSFYYIIRPQIELGPTEGVKFKTRSDFYISLTAAEKDGIPLGNIDFAKDIAVYLDGYTFHATKENNRFENDLQKRIAIVESGNKITWTLTWADIERFEAAERDNETNNKSTKNDSIKLDRSIYKSTISKFEQIPYWNKYKSELIDAKNSLERLLWLLSNPLEEQVAIQKINLSLALQQKNFAVPSIDEDELNTLIYAPKLAIEESLKANNKAKGNFYIFPEIQFAKADFYLFKVAIKIADLSLKASIFTEKTDIDLDKSQWERFWQIFNLIQTDCRLLDKASKVDTHTTDNSMSKYDCLIYHDTSLHEIIKQLIDKNIDFNKEGGFYIEHNGDFAEAMLGFEDKKYFINPLSSEDKRIFEQAGFTELSAIDFTIKALK